MASYIFTTFIFVWEDPNILLEELIEVSLWIQAQPGMPPASSGSRGAGWDIRSTL